MMCTVCDGQEKKRHLINLHNHLECDIISNTGSDRQTTSITIKCVCNHVVLVCQSPNWCVWGEFFFFFKFKNLNKYSMKCCHGAVCWRLGVPPHFEIISERSKQRGALYKIAESGIFPLLSWVNGCQWWGSFSWMNSIFAQCPLLLSPFYNKPNVCVSFPQTRLSWGFVFFQKKKQVIYP